MTSYLSMTEYLFRIRRSFTVENVVFSKYLTLDFHGQLRVKILFIHFSQSTVSQDDNYHYLMARFDGVCLSLSQGTSTRSTSQNRMV